MLSYKKRHVSSTINNARCRRNIDPRDRQSRDDTRGDSQVPKFEKSRKNSRQGASLVVLMVRDWPPRLHPFTVPFATANGKRLAASSPPHVRPMGT